MASFREGQRVRNARPFYPENKGITGTVLHVGPFNEGEHLHLRTFPIDCDCVVQWDNGGGEHCQFFWQLEPIVDQHQPCEAEFKDDLDRLLEQQATASIADLIRMTFLVAQP